uniref:Uncharacterized protein n=1 Tax=Triticum urartu TaxID=4572 RepID=A0A8R7JY35_TRIUA
MIVEPRRGICARAAEACEAMVCDLQIYSRNKCDLDFLFVCLMCRFEMMRPRYGLAAVRQNHGSNVCSNLYQTWPLSISFQATVVHMLGYSFGAATPPPTKQVFSFRF